RNYPPPSHIYTLSLHDALPISLKDIRDEYNYPKKKGIKDECSRLLEASTMKSRRGFAIQRLMNAMRQVHADGWFIVFDTLTLARSEERFSRNAETDLVCRLLLE